MIFGSVCSGIEAASVAWTPLGWKAAFFSEIEPFPSAVLKHRHPDVPNLGDMTKLHQSEVFNGANIDVLVGGTPCQSFSIAGLRKGMGDTRGNLALVFLALLDRARPRWVVWENVPGVLSSWSDEAGSFTDESDGQEQGWQSNDFDTFTSGLRELGYGLAWRVLDAQYFGVPQRRQRVFVVGHLGDWRPAAAVLFEPDCLSGNPAPSRQARASVAGPIRGDSDGQGGSGVAEDIALVACSINAKSGTRLDPSQETFAIQEGAVHENINIGPGGLGVQKDKAYTIKARHHVQFVAYDIRGNGDGENVPTLTGHHAGAISDFSPMVFESRFARNGRGAPKDFKAREVEVTQPLMGSGPTTGNQGGDIVFQQNSRSEVREVGGDGQIAGALAAEPGAQQQNYLKTASAVRRLTPRECERLQGFPDDYTMIPYLGRGAADGPRYKALGNSMVVPVMRWIGERIALVDVALPRRIK